MDGVEKKITGVAKETASRQATTLNAIGDSFPFSMSNDDVLCIRLYTKADFEALRKSDGTTRFEQLEVGACLRDREKEEEGKQGHLHRRAKTRRANSCSPQRNMANNNPSSSAS